MVLSHWVGTHPVGGKISKCLLPYKTVKGDIAIPLNYINVKNVFIIFDLILITLLNAVF